MTNTITVTLDPLLIDLLTAKANQEGTSSAETAEKVLGRAILQWAADISKCATAGQILNRLHSEKRGVFGKEVFTYPEVKRQLDHAVLGSKLKKKDVHAELTGMGYVKYRGKRNLGYATVHTPTFYSRAKLGGIVEQYNFYQSQNSAAISKRATTGRILDRLHSEKKGVFGKALFTYPELKAQLVGAGFKKFHKGDIHAELTGMGYFTYRGMRNLGFGYEVLHTPTFYSRAKLGGLVEQYNFYQSRNSAAGELLGCN